MSGFEVAGVAIGAPVIIPLLEKTCQIWKALEEARAFGSDMASLVAQLSMEYYRFCTWIRVSKVSPGSGTSSQQSDHKPRGATFLSNGVAATIASELEIQIRNAITSIGCILEDVNTVVSKYDVVDTDQGPTSGFDTPAFNLSLPGPLFGDSEAAMSMGRRKTYEKNMQRKTSFKVRLTFNSKPWGTPDKQLLQEKVDKLIYWNNSLERLLPIDIRRSIETQAIPAQVLGDDNQEILDTLIEASEHENEAVKLHANLWKERLKFESCEDRDTSFRLLGAKYVKNKSSLVPFARSAAKYTSKIQFSMLSDKQGAPRLVAVEKYLYQDNSSTNDALNYLQDAPIIRNRLTQLAHLTSTASVPQSLRILKSAGLVEEMESISFLHFVPANVSPSHPPISLHQLLSKSPDIPPMRPPPLNVRLHLAQKIANAVYSFILIRWLHKDLTPHNIIFFTEKTRGVGVRLDSPYIVGFSVSRADRAEEVSINKAQDYRSMHCHPSLRVSPGELRPRYRRRFEIWSLGLLLLEIGLWQPLDKLKGVSSGLQPEKLATLIRERADKDLPFFVGDQYRDVVSRCLAIGYGDEEESEELDVIYFDIVLELAKCLP